MNETLNKVCSQLSPAKQDVIVGCIQTYTSRQEFHRGLLPFLPAEEASRVLNLHLQTIREFEHVPRASERLILSILDTIKGIIGETLSPDFETVEMQLSDKKLQYAYPRRYGTKFAMRFPGFAGKLTGEPADGLVYLDRIGVNKWKVSAHKRLMEHVTTFLADTMR